MDDRLMIRASDQKTSKKLYCSECAEVHEFRYSHLKLAKGNRYICFVGVGCFTEHLEPVGE